MKKFLSITLFIFIIIIDNFYNLYSQKLEKKFNITGYFSFLNTSLIVDSFNNQWINTNILHNRVNGNINFSNQLDLKLEIRNRFFYGDLNNSSFANNINEYGIDKGLIDLTWNIRSGKSYLLNSTVDRFYFAYKKSNLEITVGRQRINWGQTNVWNPNDLFNVFSYFDFDYPERPGSDAIRIQYYTGILSHIDFALKTDSSGSITSALLYRFNKNKYDIQLIGGILENNDWVGGIGWSGNILNIGYKGEISYFYPFNNGNNKSQTLLASMAFDYMFSNSIMLQIEMFYKYKEKIKNLNFFHYYNKPLNVKDLSFAKWNFFTQISYPFTDLVNGSLVFMCFPDQKMYFLGPSISTTFSDNFEFMFYLQYFKGDFQILSDYEIKNILLSFIRFKYSF